MLKTLETVLICGLLWYATDGTLFLLNQASTIAVVGGLLFYIIVLGIAWDVLKRIWR